MKKVKIISIAIILLLVICISKSTYAVCNTYQSPSASKEINAIRLTLSDGTILHDITLTRDVDRGAVATEQAYKNFNLNILLDVSGSMQPRLDTVKTSLKKFINNLYEFYGNKADKIKIGIIYFNNDLNIEETEEQEQVHKLDIRNKTQIINEIENMTLNNTNMDIGQAINIACDNYDEYYPGANSVKLQTLLIITDGISVGEEYQQMHQVANTKLKDLSENLMVSIYNLEIEDYSYTMSTNVLVNVGGVRSIGTMLHDFEKNLLGQDVYEYIKDKLINIEKVMPIGLTGDAQMTDWGVLLYVDNELLYGATLEIEYLINYDPGSSSPTVTITETIDPNLTFRQDAHFLTEPNETNASKGWTVVDGKVINPNAGRQTKIVLSTMLTIDNIPDDGYINKARVGTIDTTSMITKILPPFGQSNVMKDLVRIILLVVAMLLVLVLYKIYTRKR